MVIIILNNPVQIFYDPPFMHGFRAADDVDCNASKRLHTTTPTIIFLTLAQYYGCVKKKNQKCPQAAQKWPKTASNLFSIRAPKMLYELRWSVNMYANFSMPFSFPRLQFTPCAESAPDKCKNRAKFGPDEPPWQSVSREKCIFRPKNSGYYCRLHSRPESTIIEPAPLDTDTSIRNRHHGQAQR